MKTLTLLFLMAFNAHSLMPSLSHDYSKEQLVKMGGAYMSELYLFLDGNYCDKNQVRFPITTEYCVRAYLTELLRIKKGVWANEFLKEGDGLYSKLNIMETGSPIACDVTLEIEDLDAYYFNIYCDH